MIAITLGMTIKPIIKSEKFITASKLIFAPNKITNINTHLV